MVFFSSLLPSETSSPEYTYNCVLRASPKSRKLWEVHFPYFCTLAMNRRAYFIQSVSISTGNFATNPKMTLILSSRPSFHEILKFWICLVAWGSLVGRRLPLVVQVLVPSVGIILVKADHSLEKKKTRKKIKKSWSILVSHASRNTHKYIETREGIEKIFRFLRVLVLSFKS